VSPARGVEVAVVLVGFEAIKVLALAAGGLLLLSK
jgi:hypothetical protein